MLSSLIHKWSFPICGYTAAYFFTKIKSSITAFRSNCTWRSVTTKEMKKVGINKTQSFILTWSINLCAFTLLLLNGKFYSHEYISFDFCLCSGNPFKLAYSSKIIPKDKGKNHECCGK